MQKKVCMTCAKKKGYTLVSTSWLDHGPCQSCGNVAPLYHTIPECAKCKDDMDPQNLLECGYCGRKLCPNCIRDQDEAGGCEEDPDRGD